MTSTTIKVDSTVRDRLAALARDQRTTMGALLAEVTERLERESFFATARDQLNHLRRDDPAGWEADRAEAVFWQDGTDRDTLSNQDVAGWWE